LVRRIVGDTRRGTALTFALWLLSLLGIVAVLAGLAYWRYGRPAPPVAVTRKIEACLEGHGAVVWITALPFNALAAGVGHRTYWVSVLTPLGRSISHVVDVADVGGARILL
jgi:hypothetical protein